MPVPKRKTSRTKRDTRRATHKIEGPSLATCDNCHQPKPPHVVCPNCGYYRKREVVETE